MATIFTTVDDAQDIFDEIEENGIAGIEGSRLPVRNKMKEVSKISEDNNKETFICSASVNTNDGEVAYLFDENIYKINNAKTEVLSSI